MISLNDFRVEYHGSIVLFRPVSAKAQSWCDEHMDPDALTFSDAYVVAPGYIGGILLGIERAGLTVFDTSKFSERQQAAERCIELLAGCADQLDTVEALQRPRICCGADPVRIRPGQGRAADLRIAGTTAALGLHVAIRLVGGPANGLVYALFRLSYSNEFIQGRDSGSVNFVKEIFRACHAYLSPFRSTLQELGESPARSSSSVPA
jgi:hypothetical protein